MSQESKSDLRLKVTLIPESEQTRTWEIDPEWFAAGAHPIPVAGPVKVEGGIYRIGADVYFNGRVEAALEQVCSRCLEPFTLTVRAEVMAVFLPAEPEAGSEAETRLTAEDLDIQLYRGDEIDLFEPVRDQVALAIPMRPLCREDCEGLCQTCGANLNLERCSCEPAPADSRFAVLKSLMRNQEDIDASS